MSMFSSITCPKCHKKELSIAIAHSFNKIRLICEDECGYWAEIKVSDEEEKFLTDILQNRKREEDLK